MPWVASSKHSILATQFIYWFHLHFTFILCFDLISSLFLIPFLIWWWSTYINTGELMVISTKGYLQFTKKNPKYFILLNTIFLPFVWNHHYLFPPPPLFIRCQNPIWGFARSFQDYLRPLLPLYSWYGTLCIRIISCIVLLRVMFVHIHTDQCGVNIWSESYSDTSGTL